MLSFRDKQYNEYTISEFFNDRIVFLSQKITQRTYTWDDLATILPKDLNITLTRLNYMSDFDVLSDNINIPGMSDSESDYYKLHYMAVFKYKTEHRSLLDTYNYHKWSLEEGGQRTTTLFFILSEIKKRLQYLMNQSDIKNHIITSTIEEIKETLYCYDERSHGSKSDEYLNENISLRLCSEIPEYNNIFREIIINDYDTAIKKITAFERSLDVELDRILNKVRAKKLLRGYKNIQGSLDDLTSDMNHIEQINYLIKLTKFILHRTYIGVDEYTKFDFIRRLDEAVKLNDRQESWSEFFKFRNVLSQMVAEDKTIPLDNHENIIILINDNIEKASILYDNPDNFKSLLELHYQTLHNKSYSQSHIISELDKYFKKKKIIFNPLVESEKILNSAKLLHYINDYGSLPNIITTKFSTQTEKLSILGDISEKLFFRTRWYSKQFLLLLYNCIDYINDIMTLIHIIDRFDTFIAKFITLGDGGKSGNDVETCLKRFGDIINKNHQNKGFEKLLKKEFEIIFMENPTLTKRLSPDIAINKMIDKINFNRKNPNNSENLRMLVDIDYQLKGGFSANGKKYDLTKGDMTAEHISPFSQITPTSNKIDNSLGNVPGLLPRKINSEIGTSDYKTKLKYYLEQSDSNMLKFIADNYPDDFTTENKIDVLEKCLYLYLDSIKYYQDFNLKDGFTIDTDLQKEIEQKIKSRLIGMKIEYGIITDSIIINKHYNKNSLLKDTKITTISKKILTDGSQV